ncbi:PPOX class F420-dependent oxidoreductase [Nitrosopumilus sp.]|uniref:PPOX class F420-dependent oxidoreductase n=1 Tax=Nitrosopumilus sp. TaxID=2024843 RepID=UPI00260819B0|nr:PPOX class F420-dependent oxidoreductase [Nitrosopumilus sp.]
MSKFEAGLIKLLEGKNFASFVTLLKDGSPHAAPTWIDHGDIILVNTALGRLKEKNVRNDPRVALSIYDNENPYHMAAIRGKVIEITTDGAEDHVDKLAKRYIGMDKYPRRSADEKRVLIKIQAEKIHHQDYS